MISQGSRNEGVKVGPVASVHGSVLYIRPPSQLQYNSVTVRAQMVSSSLVGSRRLGRRSVLYVRLMIENGGNFESLSEKQRPTTKVENRYRDDQNCCPASMHKIHKYLYEPHKLAERQHEVPIGI